MAGIYVHIPFCKQRCIYCDFYSTVMHASIDKYIDALVAEAKMRPIDKVKTLYLGGGTPSQLSPAQMARLVDGLHSAYDLSALEEFTVEVNPDDVSPGYITALRHMGVNRISMGVQSFVDSELRLINRRHDAQGARRAIAAIVEAGIKNISIDLIFGIPGQTLESWTDSVNEAISFGIQHISAYNLSYEPGTRLWMMRERGEVAEVDDSTCVAMYDTLIQRLKDAGYVHYEISNYCLPGWHSRHNSAYWDGTPYVGIGAAAHSYDGTTRYYNPASLNEYIDAINAGNLPLVAEEAEWWERYDEAVMVALRTSRGLNVDAIRSRFGEKVTQYLLSNSAVYITTGSLVQEGSFLRIPEHHFMTSDSIIRHLLYTPN